MPEFPNRPPQPTHVEGTKRGEEAGFRKEPGRDLHAKNYRSARDSTGINASRREPINPKMANLPPA